MFGVLNKTYPNLEERIDTLVKADFASPTMMISRYCMVGAIVVMIWSVTGAFVHLGWLVCYLAVDGLYAVVLIGPFYLPLQHKYKLGLTFYCLALTTFAFYPAYLIHSPLPELKTASIAAQIGIAMYTLGRPVALRSASIFDILLVVALVTNTAVSVILTANGFLQVAVIMASALAVMVYYTVTVQQLLDMQDELRQSQIELANARKSESVGRLVGGVAHDFNNILTAVMGNLDLYDRLEAADDKSEAIWEARMAAERAAKLTAQLMASSQKAMLSPRRIDLAKHVEEILPLAQRLLPDTTVLRCDIQAPDVWVTIDTAQFTASVLHLVVNACEAMDHHGAVTLIVRLNKKEDMAEFVVSDLGGGIPSDQIELVQEPFYSTKAPGKSSGMGLPMVRGFVVQSGGSLDFHNRPGSGLDVIMRLPLTRITAREHVPS
jgi:two-component system cell cycle sensor histidine kinase/response regulator CckA